MESSSSATVAQVIRRLNLSSERGYRADWVNVAPVGSDATKDVGLNLDSLDPSIDMRLSSESGVRYVLRRCALEEAYLYCGPGYLPSGHQLTVLAEFLEEQGSLTLDVSLGVFPENDQRAVMAFGIIDGQVRLLIEESIRSGCRATTLELRNCELTKELSFIGAGSTFFGRFTLGKRNRSPREVVITRMIRDDFGGLPDDSVVEAPAHGVICNSSRINRPEFGNT